MRNLKRAIVVLLMAALCAALFAPAALAADIDPYAPNITSQTTGPIKVKPSEGWTLQVVAESPEGLPLSYQWYLISYGKGVALMEGKSAQYQRAPSSVSKLELKPFEDVKDQLYYCVVSSSRVDPVTGKSTLHKTQSEVIQVQFDASFGFKLAAWFRWTFSMLGFILFFPIKFLIAIF